MLDNGFLIGRCGNSISWRLRRSCGFCRGLYGERIGSKPEKLIWMGASSVRKRLVGSNPTSGSHAQFPSGAGRTAKRDVTPSGLATWKGYGYTVAGWGVKLPPWAACRVAPFISPLCRRRETAVVPASCRWRLSPIRKVAAWGRRRFEPVARVTPDCSIQLPSSRWFPSTVDMGTSCLAVVESPKPGNKWGPRPYKWKN